MMPSGDQGGRSLRRGNRFIESGRPPSPRSAPLGNDIRSFFDIHAVRDLPPTHELASSAVATLTIDSQVGLDLAFDDTEHHLRTYPFAAFPFGGKTPGLRRSIATLGVVTENSLRIALWLNRMACAISLWVPPA